MVVKNLGSEDKMIWRRSSCHIMSKCIVLNTLTPDKPNVIYKMQTVKLYMAEFVCVWDSGSNNL